MMTEKTLTSEQIDIINCNADEIYVSALAGTGKTSTIKEHIKMNKNGRALYLVYNTSMKESAKVDLAGLNVDVFTFHGLAYKFIGKYYAKADKLGDYTAIMLRDDLELHDPDAKDYYIGLHYIWNKFILSHHHDIKSFLIDIKSELTFGKIEHIYHHMVKLFNMKKDLKSPCKISHDFYLKMFMLMKVDLSKYYSIIYLDEIQDSVATILDVFFRFKGKKMGVGDPNQNINGWRDTVNAFTINRPNAVYLPLTNSFRVSQDTANICDKIFKDIMGETINMKGVNPNNKLVSSFDTSRQHVIISRTKSDLFLSAFEYANKGEYISFEGGFKKYSFHDYVDLVMFRAGKPPRHAFLKNFEDFQEFNEYVIENNIIEWENMIKIINSNKNIVGMYNKIKESQVTKKSNKWTVLFTTVHSSKGQTYTYPVIVKDNMINIPKIRRDIVDISNNLNMLKLFRKDILEELNVLYVAITRSETLLVIPQSLSEYIDSNSAVIL